ncbi:ABC transporter permease [Fusibacter sp. JL298sf-3]
MKRIVLKAVKFITLLLSISLLTFFLMEASPLDPVTAYVGADTRVGAEQRALIAEQWGLNKPPMERFFAWFKAIVSGDWGSSLIYRRPVLEVIGVKFKASLLLMLSAWLLSGIIGFGLGIIAGVNEGKWLDRGIRYYCHLLIATPIFWLGMVMIILFSVTLKWFPVALSVPMGVLAEDVGLGDKLRHMVLPALTLGVMGISGVCLHTREKVIESLKSPYVLYARAQGKSERYIVFNHVVRNVLLPAVTLQFLSFSELFGGAVFVEQVFSYPGLGKATVEAGLRGDLPLLMGIVILSLCFVFVGNSIADALYLYIDPRIKEATYANRD